MIHYADRSGIAMRRKCPMSFYWNRIHEGTGIVSKKESLYLKIGGETHEDFRVLAELEDISKEAIQELIDPLILKAENVERIEQERLELLYRRIGWLAAYAIYVEPVVRKDFEDIYIEHEIAFSPREDFILGVTPDRVLLHRESGFRVYREYKTTLTSRQGWLDSWKLKPQVHLGLAALNDTLGETKQYAQIMGLMKGDIRDGRLSSPLIYAWRKIDGSNIADNWKFEYPGTSYVATGAWEYPGTYLDWIERVGEEKCSGLFPHTEPIFFKEDLLNDYVEEEYQQARRIAENAASTRADGALRKRIFPLYSDECRPVFGDPCQYREACWNASVNADPLRSGLYIPRTPHHEVEGVVRIGNEVAGAKDVS